MKTLNFLLLTTVLLCFSGCEDKKTDQHVEENKSTTADKEKDKAQEKKNTQEAELREKYTFILSDLNDSNHSIYIENKHIEISGAPQEITLLNFFATWCPPCRGEIPYLADLQKKYDGKLFIAGILVNDTPDADALKAFIAQYGVNYFISSSDQNNALAALAAKRLQLGENFPIPLSILFKNGNYYSHYEGAVPVEMLEHDIKNAMSKE